MTNRDRPCGLQVARHLTGGLPNRLTKYAIEPAHASSIFRGDAVIPVGTNKRITIPGSDNVRLQGVFQGCVYILPDGEPKFEKYWPASQAVQSGSEPDAFVYDDPKTIFRIQADGEVAAGDIGAFANLTRGPGNPATGLSGYELQSSSISSGANLKILELAPFPDNAYGMNAKVNVQIALHYLSGAPTAI